MMNSTQARNAALALILCCVIIRVAASWKRDGSKTARAGIDIDDDFSCPQCGRRLMFDRATGKVLECSCGGVPRQVR